MTSNKTVIVSEAKSLHQYKWGAECDAYVLVENEHLSVKLEQMPPGTSELVHFHARVQQFFYVLAGSAVMEVDGEEVTIQKSEGILVKPGAAHRISNPANETLRFLVTSQPRVGGDRTNV